jgi:hypothetical protein
VPGGLNPLKNPLARFFPTGIYESGCKIMQGMAGNYLTDHRGGITSAIKNKLTGSQKINYIYSTYCMCNTQKINFNFKTNILVCYEYYF